MSRDEFVSYARDRYYEFSEDELPRLVEEWQADLLLTQDEEDEGQSRDRDELRDMAQVSRQLEMLVR